MKIRRIKTPTNWLATILTLSLCGVLLAMLPIYKVPLVLKEKTPEGKLMPIANTLIRIVVDNRLDTLQMRTDEYGIAEGLVLPRGKHHVSIFTDDYITISQEKFLVNARSGMQLFILQREK